MKAMQKFSLILLAFLVLHTPDASALTVVTHFVGGVPPAHAAGTGNLADIVKAAARIWESAYLDSGTLTLFYGWAPVGDAGTHSLVEQGGNPNREITGTILFDNSGAVSFYLDPTPDTNEEYRRRTEEHQNLGGGFINVARLYRDPVGDAAGHVDLLSVAMHEIGHALGMGLSNIAFFTSLGQGEIRISGDLPFAGTVIPLASNNAGFTSHFDALEISYGSVMTGVCGDERRLPSVLDILANAQVSGFKIVNLTAPDAPSRGPGSPGIGRAEPIAIMQRSAR
jgi:hypothetical protein